MIFRLGHGSGERTPGWTVYSISALLALSILFGGGGAEGPLNSGVILAASALLLFGLIAAHWLRLRPLPPSATIPVLIIAALLAIGLVQLFPVPAGMWRGLPGRDLATSILQLVRADGGSRPLSLDPAATRRSMEALLLPAALMIGVLGSTRREVSLYLYVIVGCAVVSSVLGALQLALGYPRWLTYYAGANAGEASGVFANVNHHATFLLAAIVCVGLLIRLKATDAESEQADSRGRSRKRRARRSLDWLWLLGPLFVVLIFATGSRAGLLLLLLAVPLGTIIAIGRVSPRLLIGSLVALGLVALVLAVATPGGNNIAFGRTFLFSSDTRYAILPDVVLTMNQYWPSGSGFGTFVQVFAANENLDIAGTEFVNHAHNDLLELLIESGVAGLVWIIAAAGALIFRVVLLQVRGQFERGDRSAIIWGGFFILALIGLHSLVDFPLRTEALAGVAGVALGLVFSTEPPLATPVARGLQIGAFAAAGALSLLVAYEVFADYAAQSAVRADRGAEAVRLDPTNGGALALAAEQQLVSKHTDSARTLAVEAIRHSPLTVRAVRVLALSEDLSHQSSISAWRLASALGWRDPATQFWALRQALANHEFGTAAVRADALVRTSVDQNGERIGALRVLSTSPPFRAELIHRLQLQPKWADTFFAVPPNASDQQLAGVALTLLDLAHAGVEVTPQEGRVAIQALINRKAYGAAVAIDSVVSRAGHVGPSETLDFDQDTDHYVFDVTPFDWNIVDESGTVTSVEQSGSRRVLALETDGRRKAQPVRRYVALGAGTYRLGYSMAGQLVSPASLGLAVYCPGSATPIATSSIDPLQGSDFNARELRFTIGDDCPIVLIAFEGRAGEAADAQFTDLSIKKI